MKQIKKAFIGIASMLLALGMVACDDKKGNSEAATAVVDQINALPAVTELSLEDEDALSKAIAAFEALSAEEKKDVTNSDKLAQLEARLATLVKVDGVQKKINAIPAADKLTYADKEAVEEARQAYSALSQAEKVLITGTEKFDAWDEQESWLKKIDRVQQQIDNLPTVEDMKVTDEVTVLAVENAYSRLTDAEKAKITGAEIIAQLKDQIAVLQTAKGVQKKIENLPKIESLLVGDADAVEAAKVAYDRLSDSEKAAVTNADKLQAAVEKMVVLQKADAVQKKINVVKSTVADAQKYVEAKEAYATLTEEEKAYVNTAKLTSAASYFADMFTAYNTMLGEFPAPEAMTEANWESYEDFKDICEELPVEVLDEVEALMTNASIIDIMEEYLSQFTAYLDDAMLYLNGATSLDVSVRFSSSNLDKAYINGTETATITQTASGLTISEAGVSAMKYGINKISFTDTEAKTYNFIVVKGLAKEEIFYYDFDIVGADYHNTNLSASTNNEIIKDGIDGGSLHVYQSSGGGGWFGLGQTDSTGFPIFQFVAGTEYHLSFEFKIDSSKTGTSWWSPMRFGDNGDIGYLYDDASWQLPDSNVLYAQATVEDLGNGVYRFNSIFVPTAAAVNLDFPSWDAKFDMVVDNITLKKVNPDITRIAIVGDSITEATNAETSYPEALQMMLGYDEYFVFNFGKSASNVITQGVYPYRTWADWQYQYLKKWNPDVIITMLGTNDGRYETGIKNFGDKAYIDDYNSLIDEFQTLADEVYLNISPYAFGNEYGIEAAAVNDHIVNVQGYIAYMQNIPVIDVHSAIKVLDRAEYFPDYIHGNNKGYAEIAKAVYKGLTEGASVYKYHLKYAIDTNVAMDKTNCNAAIAVYEDPNATQEQIDAAFELIKDEMGTVVQSTWSGAKSVYTTAASTMELPVAVNGNVVSSLKLGNNVIDEDGYTVENDKLVLKAETISAMTKGVYNGEITIQQGGKILTYDFAAYVGYAEGTVLSMNGDATPYTNAVEPAFVAPCEVVENGIDGKSLHFKPMSNGNGTMLEIGAEVGWGFPVFALKANMNYSLSFQYKVLEGTANDWMLQIWWGGSQIIAQIDATKGVSGVSATSPVVWSKDDATGIITFSITLNAGNNGKLVFSNYGASNFLVDNFILVEIDESDIPSTPPTDDPEDSDVWVFDPDVTTYTSDPGMLEYICPCEVVEEGIDGKSWKFGHPTSSTGNAEWLEIGPKVGFGFPQRSFTPGAYYTLSMKYKVVEADASWGVAILAGGQNVASIYADRAEKGVMAVGDIVWTKDEESGVITFSVTFQMPESAGADGQMHIQNYYFSTVIVDDFRIANSDYQPEDSDAPLLCLDGDNTVYTSQGNDSFISPCEIVDNGIDGKSLHFKQMTNANGQGTLLEIGPAVGWGFPICALENNKTYTLSFQYMIPEGAPTGWGIAIALNTSGVKIASFYPDRAENGDANIGDVVWEKDAATGVITFSVTFTMPEAEATDRKIAFQNYGFSEMIIDNLTIVEVVA